MSCDPHSPLLYLYFFKVTVSFFTEVATGELLDLAEGANIALANSGTNQAESDLFRVHNHTSENNNTVWVRQESGWSASYFGWIRKEKKMPQH